MDRTFHRAQSFESADHWDREQMWSMTPDERLAIAKILRDRYYGKDAPDIRESERSRSASARPSSESRASDSA